MEHIARERHAAHRYYNYRREEKPDGSDVALPVPKVFYRKFTPKSNLFSKPAALNRGEVVFPPVPPFKSFYKRAKRRSTKTQGQVVR